MVGICYEVLEVSARLLLQVLCMLAGAGLAICLHGTFSDLLGTAIFFIGAVMAFAGLRPIAYRMYPRLRRSDLQRRRHGPNRKTLLALGIAITIGCSFLESVWVGAGLILIVAAGAFVAAVIALGNRHADADLTITGEG